ncbi:hypothetical protein NDU88_004602 [Pleurodeles waltl]|uniref:Uncharacterized protein n=1 Tax=Pleurodeles waltl TaxID=8319 RepID=A0AAV7TSF2_PLEWA|nr:hypothetical protein NDU88_004602 [Pleurodeles waltl]
MHQSVDSINNRERCSRLAPGHNRATRRRLKERDRPLRERERKNYVVKSEGDREGIKRRTAEDEERRRSGKRQDLSPTIWRAAGVRSRVDSTT